MNVVKRCMHMNTYTLSHTQECNTRVALLCCYIQTNTCTKTGWSSSKHLLTRTYIKRSAHRPIETCAHTVLHTETHTHTLCPAAAESVKAQTFLHKDPSQHQTLHSTTAQSKKITSELHQNDHYRATVYQNFLLVSLF